MHGDTLYITTNSDGAENFRIVTADISAPHEDNWVELVAHRPSVLLDSSFVVKDHMVRLERENALPRIVIRELKNGEEHSVSFDEEAYSLGVGSGYEFDTTDLRFSYSSPVLTPAQVWDYDMTTRERILRKEQEIPSGHRAEDYVVRRLQAPTDDGDHVPLTVLHHKDTALDGSAPCLLYGYGSYGMGHAGEFFTQSPESGGPGFCLLHRSHSRR